MKPNLSPSVSVYLNFVRWIAASAVVLYHVYYLGFGSPWLNAHLPKNGQSFVMVFFVVSGFVIAFSIDRKKSDGIAAFALDRAIRIYSVALPVLLLCALLAVLRPDIEPASGALQQPILAFLIDVTFTNEIWLLFLRYEPYLAGPYWSLSYEVWYYIIFAIWSFCTGRKRWLLLALASLIASPKILLLFPCWLFGVAAYNCRAWFKLSSGAGWAIAIGSLVSLFLLIALGVGDIATHLSRELTVSQQLISTKLGFSFSFLRNWLIAGGFALHLFGMCYVEIPFSERLKGLTQHMADMSYSLYLVHYPVLVMIGTYIRKDTDYSAFVVTICAFAVSYAFSLVTEGQRYRVKQLLVYKSKSLGQNSPSVL